MRWFLYDSFLLWFMFFCYTMLKCILFYEKIMEKIQKDIQNALLHLYGIEDTEISLSHPPKKELGDFAYGTFLLARDLKKSPQIISQEITNYLKEHTSGYSKILSEGPYVNFYLDGDSFTKDFQAFLYQKSWYEKYKVSDGSSIVIDYIGANVWKPMHIGHMCTPLQGQVFVNLYRKLGYEVIADSHIGDWGIIFWKLIVAYERYGSAGELENDAVDHLFQLYVKISSEAEQNTNLEEDFRQAFQKLSSWDPTYIRLWSEFTKNSIHAMDELLKVIGVEPLYDIGESFYEGLWLPKMQNYPDLKYSMKDIVAELIEKGIATRNEDNSVGVVFPEDMKIPSCMLQKRDGTHGYFASDLAAVKYRMDNWKPKKILYFVDMRQKLHLQQVFEISKMAGWLSESTQLFHAYNGFISLKDGAMSTRKGRIVKLSALFEEAQTRAKTILLEKRGENSDIDIDALSKIIGIGAIQYGYLKKSRVNDVVFDWDEFMNFEGNSGPYIQYGYVRAKKIVDAGKLEENYENLSYSLSEEKLLIQKILDFPSIIGQMQEEYFSYILCQYSYELTKLFSSFYSAAQILSEQDTQIKNSRLVLVQAYMKILEENFSLLGIELPQEM